MDKHQSGRRYAVPELTTILEVPRFSCSTDVGAS